MGKRGVDRNGSIVFKRVKVSEQAVERFQAKIGFLV